MIKELVLTKKQALDIIKICEIYKEYKKGYQTSVKFSDDILKQIKPHINSEEIKCEINVSFLLTVLTTMLSYPESEIDLNETNKLVQYVHSFYN